MKLVIMLLLPMKIDLLYHKCHRRDFYWSDWST